jgi:N-methylhydantoinase B
MSVRRSYRVLVEHAVFTLRSDRRRHPPYGLEGGSCGTPSYTVVRRGERAIMLPVLPRDKTDVRAGDVIVHVQPGGGGYGDPLDRDPLRVLEDVLDERFGVEYARDVYGVCITGGVVDARATEQARARLRAIPPAERARTHLAFFAPDLSAAPSANDFDA